MCIAVLLLGCEGKIASPPRALPPPIEPRPALSNGWPAFTPTVTFELRRLTTDQYVSSVKTLLGVSTAGMPAVEPVSPVGGFQAIGASSAVVSSGGVGMFEDASRFLAHAAFTDLSARQRLVPCTPSGLTDTACFRAFAAQFGARAFRRPLSSDEVDRYATLAATVASTTADAWQGLEAATSAFLQSPSFLYLSEVGEPDPSRPGQLRYTSYEMASRLSYFLTNDTPDDALLAAAASGALVTPEGVRAQTERLLALPAARAATRAFFSALLSLDALDTLSRPVQLFPAFTPTLGAALKEEALRSLEDRVLDRDGDWREAFDDPATYVSSELAAFYGLPDPGGPGFFRVVRPGTQRLGLLGQAGVLAVHDRPDGTSPTKRGLFVLTRLLCQNLPLAPPSNLTIPPPPSGDLTARERLEQHSTNAVCASCHRSMDAVGLSLEHFDALGAYRELDRAHPIDDRGELGPDTYAGEPGLAALLRQSPASGACVLQSLYGASVGHLPTEFDRSTFSSLASGFDAGGARIRAALVAITSSEGFRSPPAP